LRRANLAQRIVVSVYAFLLRPPSRKKVDVKGEFILQINHFDFNRTNQGFGQNVDGL
jgi:hypothetical protein